MSGRGGAPLWRAAAGSIALTLLLAACNGKTGHGAFTAPSAGAAATPTTAAPAATPAMTMPPGSYTAVPEPKGGSGSPPPTIGANGRCPDFPTPACTGVPAGTNLKPLHANYDGGTYRVARPGTTLDGVHITGDLLITADNTTIRNSKIDGSVTNEWGTSHYSFSISNSTIGPDNGCLTAPGLGESLFTASGVRIQGHGDGFRDGGDSIVIRDSFVDLCSNKGDHPDGVQSYGGGTNFVLDHNTIDERHTKIELNAPIFMAENTLANVRITNNLLAGGTYSIQLKDGRNMTLQGNRLVNKSWQYGPVESSCGTINWSGNTLVTIDADYNVTSTVGPLPCGS